MFTSCPIVSCTATYSLDESSTRFSERIWGNDPARPCIIKKRLASLINDAEEDLSPIAQTLLSELYEAIQRLDDKVKAYTKKLVELARHDERCQRLQSIHGMGPLSATTLLASLGDGSAFHSGRQVSAWLGLVPRQCSSGHKLRLLGISKRGDRYLRQLLIHGARSVVQATLLKDKQDRHSLWIKNLVKRTSKNVAAVALANKNARVAWALLHTGERFHEELAHA